VHVLATSVTATGRMLTGLTNTTVTAVHATTLLPVLLRGSRLHTIPYNTFVNILPATLLKHYRKFDCISCKIQLNLPSVSLLLQLRPNDQNSSYARLDKKSRLQLTFFMCFAASGLTRVVTFQITCIFEATSLTLHPSNNQLLFPCESGHV